MSGDRRRGRERGRGRLYCSHCGESLEPSMNYCPSCGRPSADSSSSGTIDTDGSSTGTDATRNRPALERRVAAAMADGWELEHDFGDHVVMVRRTVGGVNDHLVVAALTIWWTMGLGNALYGLYRYVGDAERMVLRADQSSDEADPSGSRWDAASRLGAAGCLATAFALVGLAVVYASAAVAPIIVALAVGLATVGLGLLPTVRRRLGRRRSVTTNGYARSVDERTVVDYNRPCAACSEPVGRGLERTYRKGFYLLGIPVTISEGHNYYCRRCANAEATRPTAARTSGSSESVDEDSIPTNRDVESSHR
ncbi:zinc ribbon domain-containing protein [Natronococcus pandeyae]|uniref:zinc ribbon domain-containing protein n=1 Tax=Natronococcus pandeyae TaxID=2055836 RepID=UPI0011E7FC97|nr:zinc ribbon domain-containing protein [Natronococcus pandeyae]